MGEFESFYLQPRGVDLQELARDVAQIQVARSIGESITIDPNSAHLALEQEHPPVERMEGDFGAICQVFKGSSNYFLRLPGVPLRAGDQITLFYHHQAYSVTLRLIERENERWRIDAPEVIK